MGSAARHSGSSQDETRTDQIEFRVSSDPKMLKVIRLAISYLCDLIGFSKKQCNQTTLAVDEACANIIKYAYDGETDRPIIVKARLLENGIEIVLRDFGKQVQTESIEPRDLNEIRPGGLGVHFIRSIMDVVAYDETLTDGNQLTLAKYRVPETVDKKRSLNA